MARWGRVDYRQLQRLQQRLENINRGADFDKFCEDCAKELAARMLAKVIRRTPVGQYNNEVNFTTKDGKQVSFKASTTKTGGTLRRGWTAKTHQEAESRSGRGKNAASFAEELRIVKRGNIYEIYVINPVEYASYVEFGHRTRNHQGWVQGQFMMTISAEEVERQAPQILERKIQAFMGEVFGGD